MTSTAGRTTVWHETLPIQVPLTFNCTGVDAEIIAPGNAYPWRLAEIRASSAEQAEVYARLFVAAPDLVKALEEIEGQAVCEPIVSDKEIRVMLANCARIASAALAAAKTGGPHEAL